MITKIFTLIVTILMLSCFNVFSLEQRNTETILGSLHWYDNSDSYVIPIPKNYYVSIEATWDHHISNDIDMDVYYNDDFIKGGHSSIDGIEQFTFYAFESGDYLFNIYTINDIPYGEEINFKIEVTYNLDNIPCTWSDKVVVGTSYEWNILKLDEDYNLYDVDFQVDDVFKLEVYEDPSNSDFNVICNLYSNNQFIDINDSDIFIVPIGVHGMYDSIDEYNTQLLDQLLPSSRLRYNNNGILEEILLIYLGNTLIHLKIIDQGTDDNESLGASSISLTFIFILSFLSLIIIKYRKIK